MAAVTICSDFGAPQNKVWHCFYCFPIYFPWSDGTGCHGLSFLNVELEANFFTLLFHFHQEAFEFLFPFCHKGGVICISEVIDIFPAILIPACASSSPAFLMVYSAYKLNKQGDNIQPRHTPFPIWNQSIVPCLVLTVASWPAYRFLKGRTDWFQIGKGVRQGCILSPCLFNFYAEYIMRNAGLEEAQAGIKIAGKISITSDMQMTPPLWQKLLLLLLLNPFSHVRLSATP